MSTYSTAEIVYSFTFSVGSANKLAFDNQGGTGYAAMQDYVQTVATAVLGDQTIQSLIGSDWTPVWGPVVYASDTSGSTVHADNTMGCYYSPSNKMFVVAVAGTDPTSTFDWFNEDLDVYTVVPWNYQGNTMGHISAAASTGLQILLAMTDANNLTMPAALANYIENNQVTGAIIAIGGHSLGGALSQCLALYMYENASTLGLNGQQLWAYPTAAPTPGDQTWANYYETVIADKGICYSSLYNTLDVVPLAWQASDLATIPTLYDTYIKPASSPSNDFMGILAVGAQLAANIKSTYTQVTTNYNQLDGTFDQTVDQCVQQKLQYLNYILPNALQTYIDTFTNLARFVAQAAVQHTSGYPPLLNINGFYSEYETIVADNKPTSATAIDPVKASVMNAIGIDLDRVASAGAIAAGSSSADGVTPSRS